MRETPAPVRVALVGTGWVSTHRHWPSLRRLAGVEVAGLVDRNPARAEATARSLRVPRWSSERDLGTVPWLGEIDAVVVGTPPQTHHPVAARALEMGKHVLTEKPFAVSADEGVDLVSRTRGAGRVLAVVHNLQFTRSFLRLERDRAAGELGDLVSIEAYQWSSASRRLPEWYDDLPGGLFFDESPHLLYLLRKLAGAPLIVASAAAVPHSGRRTPDFLTTFFSGAAVPVRMTMNFATPVSEWIVAAYGTRGVGLVDVFRNVYVRLPSDGRHVTRTVLRTSAFATLRHWIGQVRPGIEHLRGTATYGTDEVMRRFVDACRSGGEPVGISKDDALDVLRLQHAILARAGLA